MADLPVIVREYLNTPSVLVVRNRNGAAVAATDNFLLTMVSEADSERTAVSYTFGDPTLYAGMGRAPRVYSYGGVLRDNKVRQGASLGKQIAMWIKAYENFLRGTLCARSQSTVELLFRDQFRIGALSSTKLDTDSNSPGRAMFSFSMFVIEEGAQAWK